MNNDLITNHFPRRTTNKNKHLGRLQEQGSSENQRQPTPPAEEASPPSQSTHSSSSNGPIERIPSQQGISQTPSNSSMRKVFLSLVDALNAHRDISTQSQFLQEDHEEALSQIETALAGEGLQLWQEFCASKEYKDEDRVTPEKLLEYVDLICLPFDSMRQDTSNRNRSYPQLVLSLQVLVRPVLQLWVQKASSLNAEHTFTEERTAVEEALDNDYGDMDYQSERKPETNRDVCNVNMDANLDDDKDGDRSNDEADERESVSRPKPTKKEQDSLEMLSKRAATINPVQAASTSTSLAWIPGRYKAGEFNASTVHRTSLAVDKMAPTIDIDTAGNIIAILEEWRFGSHETPAFQDLNKQYGHHWRKSEHRGRYHTRKTVICEFQRLVSEEGMDDDDAIAFLVARQGPKATTTFGKDLGAERKARNQITKKGKAVSRQNSPMSRVPLDPSSSSCNTNRAFTSSSAFGHSTPKKTGGMKQTMLWASAGATPNNHLTDKAPTSEARNNILSWCNAHKTKAPQYCAPIPGVSEIWDKVALDRTYRFPIFDDIATVQHLWEFWTRGWQGGLSVRAMSTEHGATWRKKTYDSTIFRWYESRYKIVQQVPKLVELGWTEEEATERLEILRSREELSLEGLAGHLHSLYNIPEAISDAKYPNADSLLMTMAKSADASEGGSGSTPFMGYVGGRRAPSTHHLQSNTDTQEPLIEEMLDPFICRREDYAITLSQYDRRIKSRVDPGEVSGTDTVEAESCSSSRGARSSSPPMAGYSSGNNATGPSTTGRRRRRSTPSRRAGSRSRSRSPASSSFPPIPLRRRGSGSIAVPSVTLTGYLNGQRNPRMPAKKEK